MATTKKKWEWKTKHVIIIAVLVALLVIIGFSVKPIMDYFDKKEVQGVLEILNSENEHKNVEQCGVILNFDKSTVSKDNKFFDEKKFDDVAFQCDEDYNLDHVVLDRDNCRFIIRETENYFKRNYVIYNSLAVKRLECSKKYLNPTFSNGTFFDINNDFKSQIIIDFELEFFRDTGEENSDEYIANRVEAKKRLIELIQLEPPVEIAVEDVYLYPQRAIINLTLSPLTEYTISLLPYETDMGEPTNHKTFTFKTPENKYFGMRVKDPLTIYTKDNLPEFEIVDYNTEKTETQITMCSITPESYAEAEVYLKTADKVAANTFFREGMKGLELTNCVVRDIDFKAETAVNKNEFVRKDFNFESFNTDENPIGLYIVYFPNATDVDYNGRINKPILFGIANSHIMMKVSRDGQGFFFINDFEGNPLANQEVNVYLNDFEELISTWNDEKRDYDVTYNLSNDIKVLSGAINLGRTGEDGILEVDMKAKVEDIFTRTFPKEWEYNWSGLYKSFFVESAGNGYKSYLTSTWNAGIAPWNFGYTTDWTDDENAIMLEEWAEDRTYNAHIYTDRRLYKPGEEVNIKTIIRNGDDLSIPEGVDFKLIISDAMGKDVFSKTFKVNEYGSHSETFSLNQEVALGSYSIALWQGDNTFFWGGFNVEVFKNPKFSNDVELSVSGLNNELVNITETTTENYDYWSEDVYKGGFKIKGRVSSNYYSGGSVKNADFTYKVYKQYYYDDSYWNDCYYGCYWEPQKEFYTEGVGKIDANGVGNFEVDIDFASSYNDYKYIVEVTVVDDAGDTITGSNSIIARLPAEYKKYNSELDVYFESDSRFVPAGNTIKISGGLNIGDWTKDYNNKYVFAVKRKEYLQDKVTDANGYTRLVQRVNEIVEKVMFINYDNFKLNGQGKLELNYKLDENSEYVFEYGAIDSYYVRQYLGLGENTVPTDGQLVQVVKDFDTNKTLTLENEVKEKVMNTDACPNGEGREGDSCVVEEEQIVTSKLNLRDFIMGDTYLNVITYNDSTARNPVENDNKLRVLTEKVSYNIGDRAKVLVRLPVANSKILWTIEKNGVVEHEYIDVEGNVFFKEFVVDESFAPNAYIGVMMVDTSVATPSSLTGEGWGEVPEYKVGYAEVVVDKTDKKSFVTIKSDKETYKPREDVILNLEVKDKAGEAVQSELTVMVVDDSLISLMGNVDLNTLEKMFIKLPFSVQTSLTNIAMLRNYYFSRMGIVGGSGYGDMKGGDSAVSTRNVFKNTAYYNPTVITDQYGRAQVKFTLPDNLTNFRVMVVSNSKDNHFGYNEKFIEVRKNVIVEDRTPFILRDGDNSVIGANIFNNTTTAMDFRVSIEADNAVIPVKEQTINIKGGDNAFVSWAITAKAPASEINYTITALGNSIENSDSIANTITLEEDPILIRNIIRNGIVEAVSTLNLESQIPTNTSLENSRVEITISNSRLAGIEKILKTLVAYPYGCIEQTVSSTLPNVIVKKFESMFAGMFNMDEVNKNIMDGVARILSMQNSDGGFVYWPGNSSSDLHITPYVVRSLIYMKDAGIEIPEDSINRAIAYLESSIDNGLDETQKAEIFWTLATAGRNIQIDMSTSAGPQIVITTSTGETKRMIINLQNLDRHSLISYTYGLVKTGNDKPFVRENIENIKGLLTSDNTQRWYWDNTSDKAIFTSLLIDNGDAVDNAYIEQLIADLYTKDWESYYYSTQAKNNAFMAFNAYLVKTGTDNESVFTFRVGSYNDNKTYRLGGSEPNLIKFDYSLASVKLAENLVLSINNSSDKKLYVDYVIKQYPSDKLKVEPYSNGMQVKREIFEVLDESLLTKCSDDYWYEENKAECSKAFGKAKTDNVYEKGKLYKTRVTATFDSEETRRMLTIEDYLPGTFRTINSNFRTESSAVTQASENWNWDYKEFNPGVVMANASYIWGKDITFEYYFRPEFEGKYTYPPVTGYMMYNPLIRASGRFTSVEVK